MDDGLLVRGGKRDSRALLLKLGFALAFSIAGYFVSQFRSNPRRLPPPKSSSGDDRLKESGVKSSTISARGLKNELHILTSEETLAKIISGTSNINAKEGVFMPDFNKVVTNKFEANREKNTVELLVEEELEFEKREEMDKEIAYLRNLVEELKERERSLEIQMIEYHGLKEQEATLRELENRLKVNAVESKLLNLKIESLQADNQKLQVQLSDYPRTVSQLESAREEIQLLKMRLKLDGEHAKEKLATLHQRITELLDRERKYEGNDIEIEKLKRLKELEDEITNLRKVNTRLAEENLKFVQLFESTKMVAPSGCSHHEVQALEEASHLREENEELKKKMEQLQTDRCADVEELVYLRWVNACLRYELRNYQPPPGKTVAKDLSKCLSPDSEKKAKQLILEYANPGSNEKHVSFFDFDIDTESCSSSQTSSEECSDTSIDMSSSTKKSSSRKSKLISKVKKLVLGKENKRSKADTSDGIPTGCGNSIQRASVSPSSFEDINGRRNSFESVSSCVSVESHPNDRWQFKIGQDHRPPRSSLDVQRMKRPELEDEKSPSENSRTRSDLGATHGRMRMISEDYCSSDLICTLDHEDVDVPEKVKLKKFADVLKSSHGPVKSKRRVRSFG